MTTALALLIVLDLSVCCESFLVVLLPSLSLRFLWLLIQVVLPLLFLPLQLGFHPGYFFPREKLSYGLSWLSSLHRQKPSPS